jgi:hypothetical protein
MAKNEHKFVCLHKTRSVTAVEVLGQRVFMDLPCIRGTSSLQNQSGVEVNLERVS